MTPLRKDKLIKVSRSLPEPFQPWFRSKKKAIEIRRQQTPPETRKWATYFQQWGCIRCGKRELPHCALGFCQPCYQTVDFRLKAVLKQVLDYAS